MVGSNPKITDFRPKSDISEISEVKRVIWINNVRDFCEDKVFPCYPMLPSSGLHFLDKLTLLLVDFG